MEADWVAGRQLERPLIPADGSAVALLRVIDGAEVIDGLGIVGLQLDRLLVALAGVVELQHLVIGDADLVPDERDRWESLRWKASMASRYILRAMKMSPRVSGEMVCCPAAGAGGTTCSSAELVCAAQRYNRDIASRESAEVEETMWHLLCPI